MKKVYLYICLLLIVYQSKAQTCTCSACTGGVGSMNFLNDNDVALEKGRWMAEVNVQYTQFNMPGMGHSDATHAATGITELKNAFVTSPALRYGVNNRLVVSVILPYVSVTASGHDWSSNGLSDMMVLGDYHVCGNGTEKIRLSVTAGIKLPTGNQHPYDQELPVALSSGSYDPIVGASLVKKAGKVMLRANTFYKHSNKGFVDVYYGSFFSQSLMMSFKPCGEESCSPEDSLQRCKSLHPQFALFGGLVGESISPDIQDNIEIPNTGSYYLLAKAGIVLNFAESWSLPIALETPIYKSVNGMQNEISYRITTGLSFKF